MKNKNGSGLTSARVKVSVLCTCHPIGDLGALRRRNKNLIRFLESFVVLIIVISMPLGFFGPSIMKAGADLEIVPNVVLAQQNIDPINLSALDKAKEQDKEKVAILEAQGKAIDAYFKSHRLPLEGTGAKFAKEADKYGLDYRLMPAIAMVETTGGKNLCTSLPKEKNKNPFGWGSCKIGFSSFDKAIEVIAMNLSGNNPNTARHYNGKGTKPILETYNPPSVKPGYAAKVMSVMNTIGKEDIGLTLKPTTLTNT